MWRRGSDVQEEESDFSSLVWRTIMSALHGGRGVEVLCKFWFHPCTYIARRSWDWLPQSFQENSQQDLSYIYFTQVPNSRSMTSTISWALNKRGGVKVVSWLKVFLRWWLNFICVFANVDFEPINWWNHDNLKAFQKLFIFNTTSCPPPF